MEYFIICSACYLIGSIPFGYIIAKIFAGIDIRSVGSNNIGATNVARVLGFGGFVSVFLLDMLKGFLPVLYLKNQYGDNKIVLIAVLCIILGHMYTIYLKFKGGKGVASAVGVYLALDPIGALYALILFSIIVSLFKMISLGSILSSIFILVYSLSMSDWVEFKIFIAVLVFFIVYKHRENIKRILSGTENKIGVKIDKTT